MGVSEEIKKWVREFVAGIISSRLFVRQQYQQTSGGAASNNLPIVLNNVGQIDISFLNHADMTELIADTAGAMVTGNTELGISVTYQDADNTFDFDAQTAGDIRYAPIANGVTNGDSHDHNGGDGAQINHTTLANIGTNTHAQIDTALATAVTNDATAAAHIVATAAHGATGEVVGTTNAQTLTNKTLTSPTITSPTIGSGSTVTFTDTDVAHGMTSLFTTATWAFIGQRSTTAGGFILYGLTDDDSTPASIYGIIGSDNPADTTAAIVLDGRKKSGTTWQALATLETILAIDNLGTRFVRVLGSGEVIVQATTGGVLTLHRDDTSVNASNSIGILNFTSNDSSLAADPQTVARIRVLAASAYNTGDAPTTMLFEVMVDGTETLTEAARIDENGVLVANFGVNLGEDTLSVYDEDLSSWAPTITGSTTNPTVTYTTQSGKATRIGNRIDVQATVTVNTTSGGSGDVRISLPVTSSSGSGQSFDGRTTEGGTITDRLYIADASTAYVRAFPRSGVGPLTAFGIASLSAGDSFSFYGTYFV